MATPLLTQCCLSLLPIIFSLAYRPHKLRSKLDVFLRLCLLQKIGRLAESDLMRLLAAFIGKFLKFINLHLHFSTLFIAKYCTKIAFSNFEF